MAQAWESQVIRDLGDQYARLAAAGAPEDVLNGIHIQTEKERAKLGYTGGHDGSHAQSLVTGSSSGGSGSSTKKQQNITVIGSDADFNASSYDFKPSSDYSVSSGGSLDGGTIAGYVITALVLVVILDKLIG